MPLFATFASLLLLGLATLGLMVAFTWACDRV